MSFIKTGDAQPILHVIKPDDELEEKRKKAAAQHEQAVIVRRHKSAENNDLPSNKIESSTESDNN